MRKTEHAVTFLSALALMVITLALSGCAWVNFDKLAPWRWFDSPKEAAPAQPAIATPVTPALPEVRSVALVLTATVRTAGTSPDALTRLWVPYPRNRPGQKISGLKGESDQVPFIGYGKKYENPIISVERKSDPKQTLLSLRVSFAARVETIRPYQAAEGEAKRYEGGANARLPDLADDAVGAARPLPDVHAKARAVAELIMAREPDMTSFEAAALLVGCMHRLGVSARVLAGAKFETVAPGKPMTAHPGAWAEYLDGNGLWNPVDPLAMATKTSGERTGFRQLPADRVCLAVGQEIILEPPQDGDMIGTFGYPHAEVAGKPVGVDYRMICTEK